MSRPRHFGHRRLPALGRGSNCSRADSNDNLVEVVRRFHVQAVAATRIASLPKCLPPASMCA